MKLFLPLFLCLFAFLPLVRAADVNIEPMGHLWAGNFTLPFTHLTNTARFTTDAQRSAGAVQIPPNCMLVVGGSFRTTNGATLPVGMIKFATSLNANDWLTNAFSASNSGAFASPTTNGNTWVTILGTNIPARYIAVDAMISTNATDVGIPYINYLFVPYLPNR